MSASYINPALPSMIRGLYRADLREKSIQNMLDLAADLVQELIDLRAEQAEPSDADGAVGWFEWFKMPENTTEIAYVYENGDVFDPARGWNPPEFTIAAAEGRVFRLVRAAAATQEGENRD